MIKRIFLTVLDSFGIGAMPDADKFNDIGSNTLGAIKNNVYFSAPVLTKMGLFNIDGENKTNFEKNPTASYGRLKEQSNGKDTTIGHWEIAGIISETPLPTFPNGFPEEIIKKFETLTGRKTLCNKPYSGTEVIKDYGEESIKTGKLIVYTSADSVFQIAAHESVVPYETLYSYCEIARKILSGKYAVGRVIARPFTGEYPFIRTAHRHDFSLLPPEKTMLEYLSENGKSVIAVGKINDIFGGKGINESYKTVGNKNGMEITESLLKKDFEGICFTNLVDFDMLYGHRNDVSGYAKAISEYDIFLGKFIKKLRKDDVLIITADHGCDPLTPSTDHSREYVPLLIYGNDIQSVNLGTLSSFADIGKSILDIFKIKNSLKGNSFINKIIKGEICDESV